MTTPDRIAARAAAAVTPKAREHGRNFLASLFMAVRTAQIHDPSNQAFDQAVQALSKAAQALFQVTGGFSVRFVEDSVFLNGTRLRFEGGTYSNAQALGQMLAEKGLGGLELQKAPSPSAIRTLVLLFAPNAADEPDVGPRSLVGEFRVLGVQRFQEQRDDVRIDRRVMVVQSYGKLILALRERFERVELRRTSAIQEPLGPPRLKPVRVMQDLVELCEDRTDFVLRLAANTRGAPAHELYGVNVALLSLVMGHAIGLPRQDLVDIGLAALFIPLGLDEDPTAAATAGEDPALASLVRLLEDCGISLSTYTRCTVLGEQSDATTEPGTEAHPYARMVRCAAAYQRLVLAMTGQAPLHPIAALARLNNDRSLGLDRRWVDLLINVLRTYPKGSSVVLDDGTYAEVLSQLSSIRWDRPMVKADDTEETIDLMQQHEDRFTRRIQGTAYFLGIADAPPEHLEEESPNADITFDEQPAAAVLTAEELFAAGYDPTEDGPTLSQPPRPEAPSERDAEPIDAHTALMQAPLLAHEELLTPNDTDEAKFEDPRARTSDSDDEDLLDVTQADGLDPTKTMESFVPFPWEE